LASGRGKKKGKFTRGEMFIRAREESGELFHQSKVRKEGGKLFASGGIHWRCFKCHEGKEKGGRRTTKHSSIGAWIVYFSE